MPADWPPAGAGPGDVLTYYELDVVEGNTYELEERLTSASQVSDIYAHHPEWSRHQTGRAILIRQEDVDQDDVDLDYTVLIGLGDELELEVESELQRPCSLSSIGGKE
jgi:hypothetical protein